MGTNTIPTRDNNNNNNNNVRRSHYSGIEIN